MTLTEKDLRMIEKAMSFYEGIILGASPKNMWRTQHRENFGDPRKTIEATRRRVRTEIVRHGVHST